MLDLERAWKLLGWKRSELTETQKQDLEQALRTIDNLKDAFPPGVINPKETSASELTHHFFTYNLETRVVQVISGEHEGNEIKLSTREGNLVETLMRNIDQVVSYPRLIEGTFRDQSYINDHFTRHALQVCLSRVRVKFAIAMGDTGRNLFAVIPDTGVIMPRDPNNPPISANSRGRRNITPQ